MHSRLIPTMLNRPSGRSTRSTIRVYEPSRLSCRSRRSWDQISDANLQAGSNAVWMGMYAPVTQMRAVVEARLRVVVDNRALLLEFQLAP